LNKQIGSSVLRKKIKVDKLSVNDPKFVRHNENLDKVLEVLKSADEALLLKTIQERSGIKSWVTVKNALMTLITQGKVEVYMFGAYRLYGFKHENKEKKLVGLIVPKKE